MAPPGEQKPVFGNYHWLVSIDGIEAGNFFSATPPSATIDAPEFKTWADNGDPVNNISGGKQVTWAPVTLARGADDTMDLWQWFLDTVEQGSDTQKKEVKMECLSHENAPLFTWTLTNAVITSYSHSGANAQTQEILVNNITLKYETAVLS